MNNLNIIAYYLPQFHPVIENDEWWGKGFTEWTNVAKAKPLFRGHKQPHIPSELGFYDLRYPEIKAEQAKLAKEAGINAFCYWHYWLGNGKRLLSKPFDDVVSSGKPDFPFCLGWANHDWQRKDWNSDSNFIIKETLIKQEYGGKSDYSKHFYDMLPGFKDNRYYKIDGRLVFSIFHPQSLPDPKLFFNTFNTLAKQNNISQFYFVAITVDENSIEKYINQGYDLVNINPLNKAFKISYSKLNIIKRYILNKFFGKVNVKNYADAIKIFDLPENSNENVAPTIIPNWDHTPRSGINGYVLHKSTPKLFEKHVKMALNSIKNKKNKVIFLKSWNEWGEGNYMEPDLKFGKKYIKILRKCIKNYS